MNRRQAELLRYIERSGEASLSELAAVVPDCSSMTLWRDLKHLEEDKRIVRTRGGARAAGVRAIDAGGGMTAGPYSERAARNIEWKKRIGRAASKYVQPGKSLFFDSGSTIMALAENLPSRPYNIITHGANIAIELSQRCGGSIYAVGGEINSGTLSCTGQIAEAALEEINIDTAFMTASGFCESCGFTTSNMAEQAIKKAVIAKAPRVIMLLDSSKFDKIFPFSFAQRENIDVLITDALLPERYIGALEKGRTELVIARAEDSRALAALGPSR